MDTRPGGGFVKNLWKGQQMPSKPVAVCSLVVLAGVAGAAVAGPYDPPASYYAGVNATGPALKAQLQAAMTAGHIQRSYGEIRYAAAITDADPERPGNILLMYNRASVPATWDSGGTWNREHVWPDSRQPGNASNSARGNVGDHHAIRPCNPSINSSRGNKPYSGADQTGAHGSLGSYYFPGDVEKGDTARILFYSDVRWGSVQGLSLVDTFPAGYQMGQLAALVAWHYMDPPDEFEVRRNHAVYSQQMNPQYYTNNRNALVDLPGVVWSLYVNQENDSTVFVGDAPRPDGSSDVSVAVNLLVGQDAGEVVVPVRKSGWAGTYFEVRTSEGLVASHEGVHNAFPIGESDSAQDLVLSLAPGATDVPGILLGHAIVSNLDVTTQAGPGMGANDADDLIDVSVAVYEPSVGSFDPAESVTELLLDLGEIAPRSGDAVGVFDLFNAASWDGAPMDVELALAVGDTDAFAMGFEPVSGLLPGGQETVVVTMSDEAAGDFEAVYTFLVFNDRGMFADPGAPQALTLTVTGSVGSGCVIDLAEPFGEVDLFDLIAFVTLFQAQDPAADVTGDGVLDVFDVIEFVGAYDAGCP